MNIYNLLKENTEGFIWIPYPAPEMCMYRCIWHILRTRRKKNKENKEITKSSESEKKNKEKH